MDFTNTINWLDQFNQFNKSNNKLLKPIESIKAKMPNLNTKSLDYKISNSKTWLNGEKTKDFLSNVGNINGISDMIPAYNTENKTVQTANTIYDTVASSVSAVNPVIGGALEVQGMGYDLINNLTGGALSINNKEKSALGTIDNILGSKFFATSPAGLLNTLTKKKVEGSDTDISKDINVGYLPSNQIESNEYGGISRLFGKKAINKREGNVLRTNTENVLKKNVIDKNTKDLLSAKNTTPYISSKNYNQLQGYPNNLKFISAKSGTKLIDLKKLKYGIIKARNGVRLPSIEESKNVIPAGSLHSRLNNLPEEFSEFVTDKGIPIISGELINNNGTLELEEGGEIIQHAEIEKEEIIFRKELTNKIEELYKKYNEASDKEKSEILIKAGKLLTYEIIDNTVDNVNLIKKIK